MRPSTKDMPAMSHNLPRHAISPDSGGINGAPSHADLEQGARNRDKVVEVLSEKVAEIMRAEGLVASASA